MTLPRRCRKLLCAKLTRERHGYCEDHVPRYPVEKFIDRQSGRPRYAEFLVTMPDGRRLTTKQFYDSAEWKQTRTRTLQANPFCRCGRKATTVDHRLSIREGGSLLEATNLDSSCWPCHSRKTVKRDGGLGHKKRSHR